jgi:hypothetical protein
MKYLSWFMPKQAKIFKKNFHLLDMLELERDFGKFQPSSLVLDTLLLKHQKTIGIKLAIRKKSPERDVLVPVSEVQICKYFHFYVIFLVHRK